MTNLEDAHDRLHNHLQAVQYEIDWATKRNEIITPERYRISAQHMADAIELDQLMGRIQGHTPCPKSNEALAAELDRLADVESIDDSMARGGKKPRLAKSLAGPEKMAQLRAMFGEGFQMRGPIIVQRTARMTRA